MSAPSSSADRPGSNENTAPRRPYPIKRSWRTELTIELIIQICEEIQRYGLSDTEAGLVMDVPSSTMSDWKKEWPEFRDDLAKARTLFWIARLRRIMEMRKKDGSYDFRVEAWLHKHAQMDENGERPHRGMGRMPARVRRAVEEAESAEAESEDEQARPKNLPPLVPGAAASEEEVAPSKPKYPSNPSDYEWPGGDEEILAAYADKNPDPDDLRYMNGELIITKRVCTAILAARERERALRAQQRAAQPVQTNTQNR